MVGCLESCAETWYHIFRRGGHPTERAESSESEAELTDRQTIKLSERKEAKHILINNGGDNFYLTFLSAQ